MKFFICIAVTLLLSAGCTSTGKKEDCKKCSSDKTETAEKSVNTKADQLRKLFNGKDLKNWKVTEFGGQGEVKVDKGSIKFDFGNPLTGITWDGAELPKLDYKIELEASKLQGNDFFVGLTLPYKDSHFTLILGGWGGVLCGISSFDHLDASENETAFVNKFETNKWYKVAVEVQQDHITAFIDGKKVIDTRIDDRKVHTRPEVERSRPLGICSFETRAAYRKIVLKKLK